MSISELFNRQITIIPRSEPDDFDNRSTRGTPVETVGALQQRRRDEPVDEGETSLTEWLLFLPAGTVLDTSDLVADETYEYEVEGDPNPVVDESTGQVHHLEVTLSRMGLVEYEGS